MDKEKCLWGVPRYIEQNPVRAKIVNKAKDYPGEGQRSGKDNKWDVSRIKKRRQTVCKFPAINFIATHANGMSLTDRSIRFQR